MRRSRLSNGEDYVWFGFGVYLDGFVGTRYVVGGQSGHEQSAEDLGGFPAPKVIE